MATTESFDDWLYDQTTMRICEEDGYGPGFDRRHDDLMEDENWVSKCRSIWNKTHPSPEQPDQTSTT